MKFCVLDIETHDEYIGEGMGAGWVFPKSDKYQFLCGVLMDYQTKECTTYHQKDEQALVSAIRNYDVVIAHNAGYEEGWLRSVAGNSAPAGWLCTRIAAHLKDNTRMSYGLDDLVAEYLGLAKDKHTLADVVKTHGLFPMQAKELKEKEKCLAAGKPYYRNWEPHQGKLFNFCMTNMRTLYATDPEAVAKYCKHDVEVTAKLFEYLLANPNGKDFRPTKGRTGHTAETFLTQALYYSKLVPACNAMRQKGARIDLHKAMELYHAMAADTEAMLAEINSAASPHTVNWDSPTQVGEYLTSQLGLKLPTTAGGKPCVKTEVLAKHSQHPVVGLYLDLKKLVKLRRDFIDTTMTIVNEIQPCSVGCYTPVTRKAASWGQDPLIFTEVFKPHGRVHAELKPLGATTGRFSCSNPNLQQIPKASEGRNGKWGKLIRSMYVAEEGQNWYSLDFSNQEIRILVHLASVSKAPNMDRWLQGFQFMDDFDPHQQVANMCGLTGDNARHTGKQLNFGLIYGMGGEKFARTLNMRRDDADALLRTYKKNVSYAGYMQKLCSSVGQGTGAIKTLGGRFLGVEDVDNFSYRFLNYLIQGSAADQTMIALIALHEKGIVPTMVVHDEFCLTGSDEDAKLVQWAMEKTLPMVIPSKAEIKKGLHW